MQGGAGDVYEPIIISGMHRSGTSLLAHLLQYLGLHVGDDADAALLESRTMQEFNMQLFRAAGADWLSPAPMLSLLSDSHRCDQLAERLRRLCGGKRVRGYLGKHHGPSNCNLVSLDRPWGWKDPRNTFTLPIWLRVFPNARVLHVHRNGVDVANSLQVRGRAWAAENAAKPFWRQQVGRWRPRLRYTSLRDVEAVGHGLALEEGFRLWCHYVEMNRSVTDSLDPGRALTLSYESLLESPAANLSKVSAFAGLASPNKAALTEAVVMINQQRAYAFKEDPHLVVFYHKHARHPLMESLGYSDVLAEKD
jgi:hypothetical protein